MTEETQLLVVPHTHWDREWYQTFQQFRMRLVRAVDRVLDVLETDPAFSSFLLDGQMILLEDYLAVRPERAEQLTALARAGRIQVGPWYVQPDEFLVGGESLVRNLQLGCVWPNRMAGRCPLAMCPIPSVISPNCPRFSADLGWITPSSGAECDPRSRE